MRNNWNLYVAGVGSLDAAERMLTTFVGKLRDLGLKITNVNVIGGEYHADLTDAESSEDGWTMTAYGEGDPAPAYSEFSNFLQEFENQGIEVKDHGIGVGTLRNIPIPTA